ncbi:MAG: hypothetical protein ACPL28_09995 [bacterium]
MRRGLGNFASAILFGGQNPQSAINELFSVFNFLFSLKLIFILLTTGYWLLPTFSYSQSGWSEDRRLVFMQGGGWYPKAACCGDTIHLVWWQHYAHDEVFYKRSTDAGNTWEEDVRLTPEDSISCVIPKIAVWGNKIHIIWYEVSAYHYALCYRKSTDGGNTWSVVDTLRKEIDGGWGDCWLCVQDSNVYVVFIREDSKLVFMKSTNNGESWTSEQVVGDGTGNPHIEVLKTNSAYLVSCVRSSVPPIEILFYRSVDMGTTWIDTQIVSDNDGRASQLPMLETDDSSGIHITWYDYKYSSYSWTGDIFYRASRDSGNTWEEIDSLTVMHRAVASDILAEGNNLHLVWEDDRNGFDNNFEIYYRMSTDLGRTWGPEERLTNALYHSYCPSLACGGGYLHLFWQDRREYGNNGPSAPIYYKRKDLSVGIRQEMSRVLNSSDLILDCPTILRHNSLIRYDTGKNKDGEIILIDVTGRVVGVMPVHCVSGELVFGDFNKEVQDGVYFMMLRANNQYVVKKVLVVR